MALSGRLIADAAAAPTNERRREAAELAATAREMLSAWIGVAQEAEMELQPNLGNDGALARVVGDVEKIGHSYRELGQTNEALNGSFFTPQFTDDAELCNQFAGIDPR